MNLPDFDRIDVEDGTLYQNTKALIGVKEHEDGEIRIFIGNFTVNDAFLLREAANEIVYAVGHKNLRIEHTHVNYGGFEGNTLKHSHTGGALHHDTHPEDNDQLKGQDTGQQADDEEFNERQPKG